MDDKEIQRLKNVCRLIDSSLMELEEFTNNEDFKKISNAIGYLLEASNVSKGVYECEIKKAFEESQFNRNYRIEIH